MHGGQLKPDNVRLGHKLCNNRDFIWRQKINSMLAKRMSLDEIAARLNEQQVPTIHGTNRWTPAAVRKAFVSWTPVRLPAALATRVGDHAHIDRALATAHRAAGLDAGIRRALHAPLIDSVDGGLKPWVGKTGAFHA